MELFSHLLPFILQVALLSLGGLTLHYLVSAKTDGESGHTSQAFSGWFVPSFTWGAGLYGFLAGIFCHLKCDLLFLTLPVLPLALYGLFLLSRGRVKPRNALCIYPSSLIEWLPLLLVGLLSFFFYLGTLTPEIRYDSMVYHLSVPQLWLNWGRMIELPENGHSYFPYGYEMLYTWSLALGSDSSAKGLHWLAGLAGAWWVGRSANLLNLNGVYAVALFYFLPAIGFLSSTTYADMATGMFGLACVSFILEAMRSGFQSKRLFAMGAMLGFALATKYSAFAFLGVPIPLFLIIVLKGNIKKLFLVGVVAFLPLTPWLGRNIIYTGNPVAPLLISVLGPESARGSELDGNWGAESKSEESSPAIAPLWQYGSHLFRQKYIHSLLGLFFFVLLVLNYKRRFPTGLEKNVFMSLGGLLVFMYIIEAFATATHRDGRYAFTSMGVGSILILAGSAFLAEASQRKWINHLPLAMILFLSPITVTDYLRSMDDLGESWSPVLKDDERNDYRFPDHEQWLAIETALARENAGRVIGMNYPSKHLYFYLSIPMRNSIIDSAGSRSASPEDIHRAFVEEGFTHLVGNNCNPGFDISAWDFFLQDGSLVQKDNDLGFWRIIK